MLGAMGGAAVRARNRPGGGAAGEGKDDRRGGDVEGGGKRRWEDEKGKGKGERGEKKAGSGGGRAGKDRGAETAALKNEVTRIWTEILRLEAAAREGGDGTGTGGAGREDRVAGLASGGVGMR